MIARAVVLDFDGTLIHSNELKLKAFSEVVKKFGLGSEIMETILGVHGGQQMTRFQVFEKFAIMTKLDEAKANQLVREYSTLVHKWLLRARKRVGSLHLLDFCKVNSIPLYINSATPGSFLKPLVDHHFGQFHWRKIIGSETSKEEALIEILRSFNCEPEEIFFIGDGADDESAAFATRVNFIGVDGGSLVCESTVSDLSAVITMIEKTQEQC